MEWNVLVVESQLVTTVFVFLARRISNCRRRRRGSIQSIAPSQRFHNVAVLQTIGVEEEHKTVQVIYMCSYTGYVLVVIENFVTEK